MSANSITGESLTMSAYPIMGERIAKLNEVAQHGNIKAFYRLIIRKDVRILEDIDALPFVDTPLHIAAFSGGPQHIQFAMEMMRLKPSFARKLNLNGYSPIHLALQEGHTQMVHRFLEEDGDLVRVKGKEGRTPLHDVAAAAATEQQLDLLDKFLSDCPNSIEDVTIQNQTALHIALLENNLDAFKRLVRGLRKVEYENAREILNRRDEEGNTVLHVAVSKNQIEAVDRILAWDATFFNVNEKNLAGQTALDILEGQQTQAVDISEMRVKLERAGALTAYCLWALCRSSERKKKKKRNKPMTDERRNALLVVAALLVTVTYQAAINPPGGLWQDDLFEANTTDVLRRSPDDLFKLNITSPHKAGSAIAQGTSYFAMFMFFNSLLFMSSIAVMIVLIPGDEFVGLILPPASLYLWLCYFSSLSIISEGLELFVWVLCLLFAIISSVILVRKLNKYTLSRA